MEFSKWNDKTMSIGLDLLDNQHKELLQIINKLSCSIDNNTQGNDILIIVDELIQYAENHFSTEEALFDKFKYEESDSHKKEHFLFVNNFTELRDKIRNDNLYVNSSAVAISEEIFNYMLNWFLNHVTGSDKKYVDLFKKNSVH